ncbi:MAG: hypothetical protein IJI14_17405 [Anaerolineaceae bacterium]|nr:hypothetical protein [Anaerolineaceae bacterium]
MKFNIIQTKESYVFPIPELYFTYLNERKIISEGYQKALRNDSVGILEENKIIIQNKPFCVNCILGKSSESIFDIIGTNKLYGLNPEEGTVFAVLYGDDYLFFKPDDKRIYYKSISSDEIIPLASCYTEFLSMICFDNSENTSE